MFYIFSFDFIFDAKVNRILFIYLFIYIEV